MFPRGVPVNMYSQESGLLHMQGDAMLSQS